jgi:hypothetical protein
MAKRKASQAGASGSGPGVPVAEIPALGWREEIFVEEYIDNGGNGTRAYMKAYPKASYDTARDGAPKLLAKPCISSALDAHREEMRQLVAFDRTKALQILVGMATANASDFTGVSVKKRASFKGLGAKKHALSISKGELTTISAGEKRAVIDDLWEKLGLGEAVGKANWFDGFERIAELVRGTEKK